jgi:hypothetical protein
MKFIVMIMLMAVMPIAVNAGDDTLGHDGVAGSTSAVQKEKWLIEGYNYIRKRGTYQDFGKKDNRDKSKFHEIIISLIEDIYTDKSTTDFSAKEQSDEIDFNVVFLNHRYTEEEKVKIAIPEGFLPKNAHRSTAERVYQFISPWVHGELYLNGRDVVGGVFIYPMYHSAALGEIYHFSQGNWGNLRFPKNKQRLTEYVLDREAFAWAIGEYGMRTYSTPIKLSTDEEIVETFGHVGDDVLRSVRFDSMTTQNSCFNTDDSLKVRNECKARAEPLYKNLYKLLMNKALRGGIESTTTTKSMVDISPTDTEFEALHKNAGDYSCYPKPVFNESAI